MGKANSDERLGLVIFMKKARNIDARTDEIGLSPWVPLLLKNMVIQNK